MQTNEELKAENEILKETIEANSDMLSISAHELRTSLTALKWILKMFADHDLGDITTEQKEYIEKALESSNKMNTLVTKLLTLGRSETGAIHKADVDIVKLTEDTMSEFEASARKTDVTLAPLQIKNAIPLVFCDSEMIRVALETLIENAIKYSNKGETVTLTIEKNKDEAVEISIHNIGTTIHSDDQSKIFTKFFRSRDSVTKNIPGSGLGLYIAKHIVECNKGTIRFESSEATGTTFFITLPSASGVIQ